MRLSFRWLAALAIVVLIPALAAAQESGKITGTVTDQSGAVLPGVNVTLKSVERASTRSTVTNAQGEYVFAGLVPGQYEVTGELSGFSTKQTRTTVAVGATVAVNIGMTVGQQTEVVTVVGETAAAINTSTQDIATTVSEAQIRELPTITRNPYDLVQLSGQAARDTESDRGTGYAINGARSASTNILLDGSANNDDFDATVGLDVPLDSVQEFSVITSNFSAQYGRASGGVVNVATKSGTNQFRGTVYEFFRNDGLSANTFDNNANEIEQGKFDRHQMGFSVGGPVVKDKVHFFASGEYIRVRSQRHRDQLDPDARAHRGERPRDPVLLQRLRRRHDDQRPDPHPRRRLRDRGNGGRSVQQPAGRPAGVRARREVARRSTRAAATRRTSTRPWHASTSASARRPRPTSATPTRTRRPSRARTPRARTTASTRV